MMIVVSPRKVLVNKGIVALKARLHCVVCGI